MWDFFFFPTKFRLIPDLKASKQERLSWKEKESHCCSEMCTILPLPMLAIAEGLGSGLIHPHGAPQEDRTVP